MLAVAELPRRTARASRSCESRHDEAVRVADEQLTFWRQQGLSNHEIFRELGVDVSRRRDLFGCSRDEILSVIAACWLAVSE